ncbi:hypothetical protein SUDANB58_05949 (plasmid) [Streptomyces sp. enrichment culture]
MVGGSPSGQDHASHPPGLALARGQVRPVVGRGRLRLQHRDPPPGLSRPNPRRLRLGGGLLGVPDSLRLQRPLARRLRLGLFPAGLGLGRRQFVLLGLALGRRGLLRLQRRFLDLGRPARSIRPGALLQRLPFGLDPRQLVLRRPAPGLRGPLRLHRLLFRLCRQALPLPAAALRLRVRCGLLGRQLVLLRPALGRRHVRLLPRFGLDVGLALRQPPDPLRLRASAFRLCPGALRLRLGLGRRRSGLRRDLVPGRLDASGSRRLLDLQFRLPLGGLRLCQRPALLLGAGPLGGLRLPLRRQRQRLLHREALRRHRHGQKLHIAGPGQVAAQLLLEPDAVALQVLLPADHLGVGADVGQPHAPVQARRCGGGQQPAVKRDPLGDLAVLDLRGVQDEMTQRFHADHEQAGHQAVPQGPYGVLRQALAAAGGVEHDRGQGHAVRSEPQQRLGDAAVGQVQVQRQEGKDRAVDPDRHPVGERLGEPLGLGGHAQRVVGRGEPDPGHDQHAERDHGGQDPARPLPQAARPPAGPGRSTPGHIRSGRPGLSGGLAARRSGRGREHPSPAIPWHPRPAQSLRCRSVPGCARSGLPGRRSGPGRHRSGPGRGHLSGLAVVIRQHVTHPGSLPPCHPGRSTDPRIRSGIRCGRSRAGRGRSALGAVARGVVGGGGRVGCGVRHGCLRVVVGTVCGTVVAGRAGSSPLPARLGVQWLVVVVLPNQRAWLWVM